MSLSYSQYYRTRNADELNDDDILFFNWMDNIENIVLKNTDHFLSLLDIPDQNYRISFENGVTVKDMAIITLNDMY
jgi:hypothetical protein